MVEAEFIKSIAIQKMPLELSSPLKNSRFFTWWLDAQQKEDIFTQILGWMSSFFVVIRLRFPFRLLGYL
ncbi:hypothetical protein J41TS12_44790 [Paenibacillus antibioticophila]|uniref:Uncharacterized protein n=1 Tax=Paenibacillus antibioticophila TaxID=1274374 RepID=A0A919XZU4_9BACL|nr:hypothetical protein [Paenibacillus antibioticophila]GIO39618.1 hypothetical protein J41TS12_44790 [Paenibacillus antibioticophila]